MNLVERLLIRSSLTMSSMDCGTQIWVAHPKCGLTRARYSVRLTSVLSMNLVFLFKYPSSLLAREDCSFTCLYHVRTLLIQTPRSFPATYNSSAVLLSLWEDKIGFVFFFMCCALHLASLKRRPDDWDQVAGFPRSPCREEASPESLYRSEYFCSSANMNTRLLELMTSGRWRIRGKGLVRVWNPDVLQR